MKKLVTLVLAAALLAPLGAGLSSAPAFAQKALSSRQAAHPGITVVIVGDFYDPDNSWHIPRKYRDPSPQTFAEGQEEIRNTPGIRAILQRRGIPARNVNGVQTALNGGKIVYVR